MYICVLCVCVCVCVCVLGARLRAGLGDVCGVSGAHDQQVGQEVAVRPGLSRLEETCNNPEAIGAISWRDSLRLPHGLWCCRGPGLGSAGAQPKR